MQSLKRLKLIVTLGWKTKNTVTMYSKIMNFFPQYMSQAKIKKVIKSSLT